MSFLFPYIHKLKTTSNFFFDVSNDLLGSISYSKILNKMNGSWNRVLGYDSSELLGNPFSKFLHPDDKISFDEAIANSLAGVLVTVKLRFLCKAQNYRDISWSFGRSSSEDEILVCGVDSKDHVNLLRTLISGVPHEIANPMAIIKGENLNIRNLLQARSIDYDQAIASSVRIDQMCERIIKIVKGIKSLAIEDDYIFQKDISLDSIFYDTQELSREIIKSTRVEFNRGSEIFINCKSFQISQVLFNLIKNSHYAVRETSGAWIKVNASIHGRNVRILVSDSGTGIDKDVLDKIMTPFFTTKPAGEGMGIGLNLCKKIIESHKGKFFYDALKPNTTFVIELPLSSRPV